MGEWKNRFLDIFVYAGLTREVSEDIGDRVEEKNLVYLKMASGLAFLVFLALFLYSSFASSISRSHDLYAAMLLVTGMVHLVSLRAVRRPHLILPMCYLFLLAVFGFSMVLGTYINPDVPVTTFCVLLFAMPLIFLDKPYRMSLLLIAVTLVFCIFSASIKETRMADLDLVNGVTFMFLSIVVNAMMVRIRMRELVQQRHIERERDTDSLTGLLTKAAAERGIRRYLSTEQDTAMLLVIDIDNFKQINDSFGHAYGDAVLRLMGECMQETFRNTDVMGRFGGDEFIIFLPHMKERELVEKRVEQLTELMKRRIVTPDTAKEFGGSIGIACYPTDGADYQELFERADEALYESKRRGKNRYTFYVDAQVHHM